MWPIVEPVHNGNPDAGRDTDLRAGKVHSAPTKLFHCQFPRILTKLFNVIPKDFIHD
jgi:hypothetical protein